jgi:hypothetical protein
MKCNGYNVAGRNSVLINHEYDCHVRKEEPQKLQNAERGAVLDCENVVTVLHG